MGALFQPFPMLPRRRAQVWCHQPAFHRPRHFHDEPELNLVVQGSALIGIGDRFVRLTRGEALYFHPGQDHVLLEASSDLELFVAAVRPELAQATSCTDRLSAGPLSVASIDSLREALLAAGGSVRAEDVERIVAEIFRSLRGRSMTHVLTRRTLSQVSADPGLSGALLASSLGTDQSAISRHFRRDLNLTFVEYRARRRLMAFVSLVDAGYPLSRAALDAGFGSYAQCHRVFARVLGCGPLRYFQGKRSSIDDARYSNVPKK